MEDKDFSPGALLRPEPGIDTPFADFYRMLWFFERVEMNIRFNLVDASVFFEASGFHCWWWSQLGRKVHGPKVTAALHKLATEATERAKGNGKLEQWLSNCPQDFD